MAIRWRELRSYKLDARDEWATETDHFTPWVLANLDRVGDVTKIDLDPTTIRREVRLGQFRADIVLHDRNGRTIVIENQFGPSDHDHFARLVTYACEARADVVIWIVAGHGGRFRLHSPIRNEHQRAIAVLNRKFAGDVAFYGIEVVLESDPIEDWSTDHPCIPRLRLAVGPSHEAIPSA